MQCAFWFLFLPTLGANLLTEYQITNVEALRNRSEIFIVIVLFQLLFALILVWGTAGILSIGKRMLQAKSGRTRTSMNTVNAQVKVIYFPFLLTSILRSIHVILWGLLLIVPGIVYFFRTALYPVIVICEGTAYRPALKQCIDMSRGQLGSIAMSIIGLSALTLFPAQLLAIAFDSLAEGLPIAATLAANLAASLLFTLVLVIYLLGLIGMYDYFKPKGHVRN